MRWHSRWGLRTHHGHAAAVRVRLLRTFLVLVLCFGVPLVFALVGLPPSASRRSSPLPASRPSIECERPFSGTPSKNHRDLERFAIAVSAEVEEVPDAQRASKYAF